MKRSIKPTQRLAILATLLLLSMALATPASALDFSVMGSWWDTDSLGQTAGGGIRLSWAFGNASALDLSAFYFQKLDETKDINNFGDLEDALIKDGIDVIPIDLGTRFGPGGFYLGGGITYFMIDAPSGVEIDDEVGWYGSLGWEIGDDDGLRFVIEGIYRDVEGRVNVRNDSIELNDIPLDLGGIHVNAGVTFAF